MTGFIYAIGEPTGPVKIGFAVDPARRLGALRCGSVSDVRLIGVEPGDVAREKELHLRFSAYRVRGEWFHRAGPVLEYVERLDAPPPTKKSSGRTCAPMSAKSDIFISFLNNVETFLAASSMSATRFGKEALGDPGFIFDLRKGREPSLKTANRILEFIASHEARPTAVASKEGAVA